MSERKTEVYVFFRGDMWYPIDLYDDEDAIRNAEINIGTTKVENAAGKVIWELKINTNN